MRKSRRKGDRAPELPAAPATKPAAIPMSIEVSLDESWDQEYEVGVPVIELAARGKGNRGGWRSWNPDLVVAETNCLELIQRAHPQPLTAIDTDAVHETQSYLAEPSFAFRLVEVPLLTAEALKMIHPCLLYRLLWLDGLTPGTPRALDGRLSTALANARNRILSPRAASRASKHDRRRSSIAKLPAAHAHSKRRELRQYPLGPGRNNTKGELRVIDHRLRLLRQILHWSDGKVGRLIIESLLAWDPAPCRERVQRWMTDQDSGDGNPDPRKAEEWVRTRLRARN